MQGGITADPIIQGKDTTPTFDESATSGFERFRLTWRDSLQDEEFVSYVRSKLPRSLDNTTGFDVNADFANEPTGFHPFLYDAVTALGVSMCRAGASSGYFTGEQIYSNVRELDIEGATGKVRISTTGTRDYTTLSFALWNVRIVGTDSEGFSIIEFAPSYRYDAETWTVVPGNAFQFAGGSVIVPDSLPPVNHDYNYLTKTDRIFGYTLMSIVVATAIASIIWTVVCRKSHVVNSSQPLFLIVVGVGSMVMALATFPAGLDETVVSSINSLDIACMAVPWLYFLGSNIATGALLAKTRAVHQVSLLCVKHLAEIIRMSHIGFLL
jgi:7 transmembrane sweet-taste receptor of 3 GCPR